MKIECMNIDKFIEFYNHLLEAFPNDSIGKIVEFINFFMTDDLELYEEFKNTYDKFDGNFLIPLYAKRYGLDPQKDLEKITYIVYQTFNSSYSFHLTSSANLESIKELGLNPQHISTIEESQLHKLKQMLTPEQDKRVFTFKNGNDRDLYFSRCYLNYSSYGRKPEWISILEKSYSGYSSMLESENPQALELINEIIIAANNKYNNAEVVVLLIPSSYTKSGIRNLDDNSFFAPEEIKMIINICKNKSMNAIDFFYSIFIKESIDEKTDAFIPASDIVVINRSTKAISKLGDYNYGGEEPNRQM